jgi:hypothetical protein
MRDRAPSLLVLMASWFRDLPALLSIRNQLPKTLTGTSSQQCEPCISINTSHCNL